MIVGKIEESSGDNMRRRYLLLVAALLPACQEASAQQEAIATGEQVYEEHCASCHGERLRPTGAVPDLKQIPADQKQRFDTMVLEGKGQMPPWAGVISDEDRDAVWQYIRSRAR